jgi:DNA-binding response OmpR family regulator
MRVGLLEDDVAIQEMLLLVLQDEGYVVVNFPSAEACLEAFDPAVQQSSSNSIDLMIVDWRLNGSISGIEVIKHIRADEKQAALPIILTTAATYTNTEELQQFNIALLEKPFSVDDMTALIKELTQQRSS